LIDIGVESVRDSSGSSTTILQNTNSLNRAAEIALENSINIPPTIHIDQGTAIQVFVARDLDFRSVSPR
jgi:type IV secretion system protein VirB10